MPQPVSPHSQLKLLPLDCSNSMVHNEIITPVVSFLMHNLLMHVILNYYQNSELFFVF